MKTIREHVQRKPEQTVMIGQGRKMTYQELWMYSDRLAAWLLRQGEKPDDHLPVAVYGHKHPWMLACFLGCVKAGRAYCPIDISVPDERVKMILNALPSKVVLSTEALSPEFGEGSADQTAQRESTEKSYGYEVCGKRVAGLRELEMIFQDEMLLSPSSEQWVQGDDTYYMIFTSGSTGVPKGVEISADCLGNYLDWSVGLGTPPEKKRGQVFLNQAPFSFDLSVMDLYTCLASGGTLYCLEKQVQSEYRVLMQALERSGANVWVSTPSFADVCLSEPKFNRELLPGLQVFLFCGETLGNRTARKLMERFPDALIVNTYGPTESTVAVTDVLVTKELAEAEAALPVGKAKPGTRIEIRDEEGNCVPEGEKGEIIIIGNTVSTGYYRQEELTEKAFFRVPSVKKENSSDQMQDGGKRDTVQRYERGYHTGDEGYLQDGMLYYCGRIDLQIKLHGYRIELEDIENNIRRLPEIEHAVVVPNQRGGKVTSLTAYVVPVRRTESMMCGEDTHGITAHWKPEDEKAASEELRARLAVFLPSYMIPKKFVFLEQMPMTNNGKADRKLLGGRKA